MKLIQLLYVKNIISRRRGFVQQELAFVMLVENRAYDKQVEVHWAGEDRIWHTLKTDYRNAAGQNQECWHAQATFHLTADTSLPGNIQFALHYRVAGQDYWDNDNGKNYKIDADSGVQLGAGIQVLNVDYRPGLHHSQQYYPFMIAVNCPYYKQVYIKWTTNNWKTTHTTYCHFMRNHWDRTMRSNARNPNRYGCEIWIGGVNIGDAYRLEYAVGYETDSHYIVWDNNFGSNYVASRERLRMLTLNLHCYQEDCQDEKFRQIAKAINDLNIDIVCLQEVGENWNGGQGDWNSNAAKIINERLRQPYHLHTDWAHLGFNTYREGVAILSRYEMITKDSGYVSASQDVYDIHSRKIVMAQVRVPYMGLLNVFSTHLSWWTAGFREQFENLHNWANQKHTRDVAATFLCGDFNIKAGSEGYRLVTKTHAYADQFLKATNPEVFDKLFEQSGQAWDHLLSNDGRVDFIFMKHGGKLKVTSARVIFTKQEYGWVSDHNGHLLEFEIE